MICIVGNGAIGNLLAWRCQTLGINTQFVLRSTSPIKVSIHAEHETSECLLTPVSERDLLEVDVLILPLKAYQIEQALTQLHDRISASTTLVLMHNGMGTLSRAQALLPKNPFVVATTSYGAYKPNAHQLQVTARGKTSMGWTVGSDQQHRITDVLSSLLPPTQWHDNIQTVLWNKLAINAVINPLTALHKVSNGELKSSVFATHIADICAEVATIMTLENMPTSQQQLIDACNDVIDVTANNYSSMYQDMKFGRKTEIEFISGHIVAMAQKHGIAVPVNTSMLTQVREQETPY